MKKHKLLFIASIFIISLVVIPRARAEWTFVDTVFDQSFSIDAVDYYSWHQTFLLGQKVEYDFSCTAGGDQTITFLIFDDANFTLFSGGYDSTAHVGYALTTGGSGEFEFPYSDDWYFVFVNIDLFNNRQVDCTIDLYQFVPPVPPFNPVPIIIVGAVIGVVGVVVIIFLYMRRRKTSIESAGDAQI